MRSVKSLLLSTTVLATLSLHAQAFAQAPGEPQVDEVIVTGSRVITNGNNSPTPLTVVLAQDLMQLQPGTVADAITLMPAFTAPRGQLSNPNAGVGGGAGGNGAANQLNLRGLGSVRTLVLFDGHRVPPTSANGIVDVDMIPQLMLSRVDIVTGGASAVYGSDAMTGVVNFVTDRNFNGVKVDASTGISQQNDAAQYSIGVAAGTSLFGGRGHIEGSYEYHNDKGILFRSERPYNYRWVLQGSGTAAAPNLLSSDTRLTTHTFGGLITSGVLNGMSFEQNGVLSAFVHGTSYGVSAIESGGSGAYYDGSLKSPLESHQVFGRFDYDLTDKIHAYVEVAGNQKDNVQYVNWTMFTNLTLSSANPYLPQAYRTQLTTAGQTTFRFSKMMSDAGRLNPIVKSRQAFANAGIEGEFGDGYRWDIGYVHSFTELLNRDPTNLNNAKLYAALDAVTNPANGQIVCSVTLTNPTAYPGCVPLNPFGPTSDSAEAVNYFLNETHFDAYTLQDDLSGSLSGSPFSLPAGPVNMAISGEYRRQAYRAKSDATPLDVVSCVGLRFNCTASTASYFQTWGSRSRVSQSVWEGAAEFDAPLLRDLPLVQSFNLNGAIRYTNYNTSGAYKTWKLGLDWHINDSIRLRGTRSRDIRAPNLDDLFASTQVVLGSTQDYLTNLPSVAPNFQQGNALLKAEIGETTTGGVVLRPSFIPRFSLSVDAYDIKIKDAIGAVNGTNQAVQRACYASGGTSPYCATQVRPFPVTNTTPANQAISWSILAINIAELHTWGADIELNYATTVAGRPVSLRSLWNYQPHSKSSTPGLTTTDSGGVGNGSASPIYRTTTILRVSPIDNLNVDILQRWRPSLKLSTDPTAITIGRVKSVGYTNITFTYALKRRFGDTDLSLNVANLFNAHAPHAAGGGAALPGQFGGFLIGDDPIGRYFTFGIKYRH